MWNAVFSKQVSLFVPNPRLIPQTRWGYEWRSKVVCYPVVWLEHQFGNPFFSWRGFNSEQRLSLQRLALGRGAVGQRVWLCRNLLFCSWCITISITARGSWGGTRVPSKPRVLLHPDSVCPTPFHLDLSRPPRPRSPRVIAQILDWGSAVQVNQLIPTQLPSTSPSFFYRHRPLPHLFPLRQSASCAVGGASMPIVPRATTENGFQNKSTRDPYGSRLSTFPLHLASWEGPEHNLALNFIEIILLKYLL